MKIKMFETFSGIGAQHKALSNLKKNKVIDFEVIGTSDWDVYSVQSYAAIHHNKKKMNIKNISLNKLITFLENKTFSKNGKSSLNINIDLWTTFLNQNFSELQRQFVERERESISNIHFCSRKLITLIFLN